MLVNATTYVWLFPSLTKTTAAATDAAAIRNRIMRSAAVRRAQKRRAGVSARVNDAMYRPSEPIHITTCTSGAPRMQRRGRCPSAVVRLDGRRQTEDRGKPGERPRLS